MILAINMNPAIDKVYAVDDYQAGKVFRPRAMTATAGGKGLNVARVAYLLGEKVIVTGMAGGSIGRLIEDNVKQQGLDSRFVPIQGESRICINVTDEKNNTSTEILEPGPVVTPEEADRFLDQYMELLEECSVVTASGSLPEGMPRDFYALLIRLAKERGKKFILDTSGEFFKEGIKEKPYMIKPNIDELTSALGFKPTDMSGYVNAIKMFKDQGIQLPVISLGKRGCIAALEDGIYHFTTPDIKVVNTVGSGDSFVAGCAAGLCRNLPLADVIKLGMACGTANTQFFKTGWITVDMVNKFIPRIKYEKLSSERSFENGEG
ncbi:MAG TPA: 1-phosphofructokinase family hexose kinase [Clostridiales bacterium]|nr:1-phosphofructokinase family hexose kinase [Clostridiales bacterium]